MEVTVYKIGLPARIVRAQEIGSHLLVLGSPPVGAVRVEDESFVFGCSVQEEYSSGVTFAHWFPLH